MKHTPGPVEASENCGAYPICAVEADYETWYVNAAGAVREEAGDDARFIAWCYNNAALVETAPELLEAAKAARAYLTDDDARDDMSDAGFARYDDVCDALRAAIAKAKGES